MKLKTALLLTSEGQANHELAVPLRQILEPHFNVEICTAQSEEGLASPFFIEAIRDSETAVMFLAVDQSRLDSTMTIVDTVRRESRVPLVLIIEAGKPDQVFELAKDVCDDFVTLPLKAGEVLARAWRLVGQAQPASRLRSVSLTWPERRGLIGESATFLTQVERISQIAKLKANVLLTGETGTGKELYARAIHYSSLRARQPFMPVNCGAIPADLVENELFGHERGAFTSAVSLQTGLIEEANGGTLFLDEIDCLPVLAQVKLLRFLQEKEYRPLGSPKMRQANVRVIAASNANLEEAVGHGKVRQDLFYRLNIISITLPPLRERKEDIPLLAHHFLAKYGRECEKELCGFSREALHLLMVYHWPGNVRELEHAIERASVLCNGRRIEVDDLLLSNTGLDRRGESLQEAKAKEIARFEKNYIQGVLSVCKGNITHAAQVAQKNRRAFWQLIQKHDIDVARFKAS
ncbi:MAG TPA: sigma-54 dependent transcriptional regulator [Pyrinomonadaceae bacterium]|nr:sigma-54 dependent transcriptional regulator [Pyrinomonadaceae bacterium]